jgi:hypothetical protein
MHREHWNSGAKKDFPRFSAGLPLEVRWGEGGAPTCTVHLIDHIPHRELRAAPCRGGEERSQSIQSTRCRADPAYLSPTATCETAYPAARISPARCQPAAACCGPSPHRVLAHLPGSSTPHHTAQQARAGRSLPLSYFFPFLVQKATPPRSHLASMDHIVFISFPISIHTKSSPSRFSRFVSSSLTRTHHHHHHRDPRASSERYQLACGI